MLHAGGFGFSAHGIPVQCLWPKSLAGVEPFSAHGRGQMCHTEEILEATGRELIAALWCTLGVAHQCYAPGRRRGEGEGEGGRWEEKGGRGSSGARPQQEGVAPIGEQLLHKGGLLVA